MDARLGEGIFQPEEGNKKQVLPNMRHAPAGVDIGDLKEVEKVLVMEDKPVEANGHMWYPADWKGWVAGEWLDESRTPQGE